MNVFKPDQSIHDLIYEAYLTDLPIGSGTGSIDDPIIMLPDINYVQNEYEVLTYLGFYRKIEWERKGQILLSVGDKDIDCLTISVTDLTDGNEVGWTEEYYFDVTHCIDLLYND